MLPTLRSAFAALLVSLSVLTLHAHPDHAPGDLTSLFAHPFSGIDHFIVWLAVIVGVGLLFRRARRLRTAASYAWVGAGVLGGAVLIVVV